MTTYTRNTTYLVNTCFSNNTSITKVELMDNPWYNNSMYQAFFNCDNLTNVNGISDTVTNMDRTFWNCKNLTTVGII